MKVESELFFSNRLRFGGWMPIKPARVRLGHPRAGRLPAVQSPAGDFLLLFEAPFSETLVRWAMQLPFAGLAHIKLTVKHHLETWQWLNMAP